jgi:hypothetical protein
MFPIVILALKINLYIAIVVISIFDQSIDRVKSTS